MIASSAIECKIQITCCECGATREVKPTQKGNARTPRGWHNLSGEYMCGMCWSDRYVRRGITFAAAELVDAEWKEFNAAHRDATDLTREVYNLVYRTCFQSEPIYRRGEKLAPAPNPYCYPIIREAIPEYPPDAVSAVEQAAKLKYNADRFDMIVRGTRSVPSLRGNPPFPVRGQSWRSMIEDEKPFVVFPMMGKRWKIRLKGGSRYKRQLAAFASFVANRDDLAGEMSVFRKGKDLLIKIAGWIPKHPKSERNGTLWVKTGTEALIYALNAKEEKLWTINADNVRRWNAEYYKQLHRWSEDQKMEERPDASFQDRRTAAVAKHRNRLKTCVQQYAAQVAGYADRRNFACVEYDGSVQDYVDKFPWYNLRQQISDLCDARGIVFVDKSNEEKEQKEESTP
jgi:hypothetical protein